MSAKKKKFYYCTNGDGTTRKGFVPFANGDTAIAPDWIPNPEIECGNALHIVEGHPLKSLAFVYRVDPIFYEVEPIDPMPESGGKIRCSGVKRLRKLGAKSPEFNQAILQKLALEASDWCVRQAAAQWIEDQAILQKLALEDSDWLVRRAAVERIEDQAILQKIALEDSDWLVRRAAVERIESIKKGGDARIL